MKGAFTLYIYPDDVVNMATKGKYMYKYANWCFRSGFPSLKAGRGLLDRVKICIRLVLDWLS